MKDLVVSRDELQILTNCMHGGSTRYAHVEYPFYELELFTLDIRKPELKDIVRDKDFDRERLSRMPSDRSVSKDELPGFNDLRNCLLTSGFLRYRNHEDIASTLIELREQARDPNKRPRPVFVAVDSNALYYRFFSRSLPMTHEPTGRTVNADDFRYVLSEVVRREIDSRITHKFDRDEIEALGKLFGHRELLQEFRNASGRRGRVAKLALNEMNYLLGELRALRIKGNSVKGREFNDIEIARSYGEWASSEDYDVLLLTADRDMTDHARSSELMTIQLEYPHEVPQHGRIDPWAVSNLVYDLALMLGVISVSNAGILVFGEWRGKTSADYAEENVMVRFEDEGMHSEIARQCDVCRRILG